MRQVGYEMNETWVDESKTATEAIAVAIERHGRQVATVEGKLHELGY